MRKINFTKEKNSTCYIKGTDPELVIGIAAKNSNTTNYDRDFGKVRKNEKYLMKSITGVATDKIFFLNQMHEDQIIKAVIPTENRTPFIGNADALITERKSFVLVIRTADCVPVILYDKENASIAAIHSGWRSTEKKITTKTIKKMQQEYQTNSKKLKAYILPAISKAAYQVSEDVAEKFTGHFSKEEDGYYLDLVSAIEEELLNAGLQNENIHLSGDCTFLNNDKFFSHRKGEKGRNLNFVYLKEHL